jgi:Uma2 family endonuclease
VTATAADLEMDIPAPVPTADDPFALGWRYDPTAPDGVRPLTEDDLVFPAEEDFVVNNHAHIEDRGLVAAVFQLRALGRPGLRVLGNHRIDFQVPGLKPLGPDVIVLNGEDRPWDPGRGTFPVVSMAARPLVVVEITSPTTRRKDLTEKMTRFYQAGVPLYVLVDLPYGGGRRPRGIVAHQAGPAGYEPLPPAADGRVWVEVVDVWLADEAGRVALYDAASRRFADYATTKLQLVSETARADAERKKADAERKKADAERKKADAERKKADAERKKAAREKARADAADARVAELEAELRRLRGQ